MLSASIDDDSSIRDKLPMCSCGRDKVISICTRANCPQNQTQTLYCYQCPQDDDNKHDHGPTSIYKSIETLKKQWIDFTQKLHATVKACDNVKSRYGQLLEQLDQQARLVENCYAQNLLADSELLAHLNGELSAFVKDRIDTHYAKVEVVALMGLKQEFDYYNDELLKFNYFTTVDDAFIANNYKEVLISEAPLTLDGCSLEQVKIYLEMKQQAVRKNLEAKEETKDSETDTGADPMGQLTSTIMTVKRNQTAILALVGGFPGMAAYIQEFRVLQFENTILKEKVVAHDGVILKQQE